MEIDVRDVLTICGLSMVFAGLWWMYPPSALIVVGTILFWAGTRPEGPEGR